MGLGQPLNECISGNRLGLRTDAGKDTVVPPAPTPGTFSIRDTALSDAALGDTHLLNTAVVRGAESRTAKELSADLAGLRHKLADAFLNTADGIEPLAVQAGCTPRITTANREITHLALLRHRATDAFTRNRRGVGKTTHQAWTTSHLGTGFRWTTTRLPVPPGVDRPEGQASRFG